VAELPKPALVGLFEAVAGVMELDEGKTRLELECTDGYLRRWWTHDESNGANELARYDEQAAWLVGQVPG
jgi:hypothetical protein